MTNAREKLIEWIIDEMIAEDWPSWSPARRKTVDRKVYQKPAETALRVIEAAGGWAPPGHWIAPDEPSKKMQRAFAGVYAAMAHGKPMCAVPVVECFAAMRTASLEENKEPQE